jgi:hypothetical protein
MRPNGPGTRAPGRAVLAGSWFSGWFVALGLANAGCQLAYDGLGPDPVEAGTREYQDDARAGDSAAQDSAVPESDSAAQQDSAAPDGTAPPHDSAAPDRDALAADAVVDRADPDVQTHEAGIRDAPAETEAGCDPLACMTPACCGDICQTTHSNGAGQTYYDCNPIGAYGSAAAMAACTAFTGDASRCSDGWYCSAGDNQVCAVDDSDNCQKYCWTYSGPSLGVLSDCRCPVAMIAPWN